MRAEFQIPEDHSASLAIPAERVGISSDATPVSLRHKWRVARLVAWWLEEESCKTWIWILFCGSPGRVRHQGPTFLEAPLIMRTLYKHVSVWIMTNHDCFSITYYKLSEHMLLCICF